MKWLIYFLLICNIGFAAWHFRGLDMREDGVVNGLEISNENQLVLLSEFKQQQESESSAAGKLCYSLGPFIQKSGAKKIQALLQEQDVEIKRIRIRDTSRSGYWVILPASKSRKEANKSIQRLKKLKIRDYFLVATGPHENAISLGVFSLKKHARQRVDEMIRLGFIPRMERVAFPRKVYWLNWYKESENQPDDSIIRDIKKQHSRVSRIERSCK